MNRWLLIGSLAGLLIGSTGCLHHNTRGGCSTGDCASGGCSTGTCGDSSCGNGNCGYGCQDGSCGKCSGMLGKIGGKLGIGCGYHGGRTGCVTGPIGWQQGGLNYSSHLNPGFLGHHAAGNLNNRPFTAGPPSAQTAYPYYSVRGPRDFLLNNPPTIGH